MKKDTSETKKQNVTISRQAKQREGFAAHIGIDLGDKHCEVCVFDQDGEFRESLRLPMKAADLQRYLMTVGRSRVAIEAGGQSGWVAGVVEQCGHQVFVSNTRKVAYIHQSDDKNDPGDAYKLAELVYFKPQLLHPIQHRSQQAQADLTWIRAREVLVESRTQLVNAVRGMSKSFGERLAKCSTEAFTARLADQVPEAIRGAVAPLLEMI